MLTEEHLLQLMADIEADFVERTTSTSNTDKFCQAVCAFANDFPNHRQPGYLLIGVADDGTPSGLHVTDQLLQNLGGIRSDGNIQPLPAIVVQKVPLSNGQGDVAVVEVFPSDLPPLRYKGQIWIRVGPRRAVANETEERLLIERRTYLARTFDSQRCPDSHLHDLSTNLFLANYLPNLVPADTLAGDHRDVRERLASCRFYDLSGDRPTHAGIVLFGTNPLQYIPGALVQFVRFDGVDLAAEPLVDRAFSGDLLTVLRELDGFLPTMVRTRPQQMTALKESSVRDYPLVALRELLMNAIMHRLYESNTPVRLYWFGDRIEIQNPGGLYGEANPENFPRQNSYRNPVIAEAMKVLGYVNKYGRGVVRAQEAMSRNGNPPVEFTFQPTYVLATLRRT